MPFPFLVIFLIFLLISNLLRTKALHEEKEQEVSFWERESLANQTRRKDISNLDYVTIPLNELPFGVCKLPECQEIEEKLTSLSQDKILKLSNLSNTDIKLEYGAANLPSLSKYDANFTELSNLIFRYGELLNENGFTKEAIRVLEYGVSIEIDMSKLFLLLAKLYCTTVQTEKLNALMEQTSCLSPLLQDSTKQQLKAML